MPLPIASLADEVESSVREYLRLAHDTDTLTESARFAELALAERSVLVMNARSPLHGEPWFSHSTEAAKRRRRASW